MDVGPMKWTPLVGVGPFRFGHPIRPLIDKCGLVLTREAIAGDVQSDEYRLGDHCGVTIYVDRKGLIDSVYCQRELVFKGMDLLQMTVAEIVAILGQPSKNEPLGTYCDDWELQFDELGLTVWGLRDSSWPYATMTYSAIDAE